MSKNIYFLDGFKGLLYDLWKLVCTKTHQDKVLIKKNKQILRYWLMRCHFIYLIIKEGI